MLARYWPVFVLLAATLTFAQESPPHDLIASIETSITFPNRDGHGTTWFQPRGGAMPSAQGPVVFLTMQQITGSDYYGTPHWSQSNDLGKTWSEPVKIPGLGRIPISEGLEMDVCDSVPDYHAKTNTVLAIGYSNYYRKGAKDGKARPLYPLYFVRSADGSWSAPKRLEWDDPRAADLLSSGCGQRITLPDGDVLVPVSFGSKEKPRRSATTLLCSFDGKTLAVKKAGAELPGKSGRGFIEPSVAVLDGVYYLTIRSEDGRGYVSTSTDGLSWQPAFPWAWENGEPLTMSTTQQHWLVHSQTLYLVYTRKAAENTEIFRWRAPLYLAAVDRKTMRLVPETERIVFPIEGDGVKNGANVPYFGNFHVITVNANESFIAECETRPNDHFRGDQLLARIKWKSPNEIAQ